MPIECEIRDGALVWIKNPITGVISYVVDVRGKSFAFTLGGREETAHNGAVGSRHNPSRDRGVSFLSRQRKSDDARALPDDARRSPGMERRQDEETARDGSCASSTIYSRGFPPS